MALEASKREFTGHPDYVVHVGRLCAAWSFFELITDDIIWGILKITPKVGSLITAEKDIRKRWSIIINHAEGVVTKAELERLRDINKALEQVASDRNVIVHGQILHKFKTKENFAVITRGANAGKFHPMSAQAVQVVINNIQFLAEAAKKIANAHLWLEDEPKEGEIVKDWPKPIEG